MSTVLAPAPATRKPSSAPSTSGRVGGWLRDAAPGMIGFAVFLLVWEVGGRLVNRGRVLPLVPPFSSVVQAIVDDGWRYYRPNAWTTLRYALAGWAIGNLLAIVVAAPVAVFPKVESVVLQIGVTTYCLPLVAVAPILFIAYEGNIPYVAIAVLFVFFTTLVLLLSGLRSADPTALDVVRAYGGGRAEGFRRVRFISALPSFFAGMRIGAPAAVLGAVLAEFFQPADSGLGVGIIRSQQQLQIARTWGIALVSTLVGTTLYLLTAILSRIFVPWAPKADV